MILRQYAHKKELEKAIYDDLTELKKGTKPGCMLNGVAVFYLLATIATIVSVERAGVHDRIIVLPSAAAFVFFTAVSILTSRRFKAKLALRKLIKSGAVRNSPNTLS